MKNKLFVGILFSVMFLAGCNIPVTTVTEYIGNWTCVGQGRFGAIEGYANCKTQNGGTYDGEIWGHAAHGKGKLITSKGEIEDGYFNNGNFVAGKITFENGSSGKGLWYENGHIELGKIFDNGSVQLGEFTEYGGLSYGLINSDNDFLVGKSNLRYIVSPSGCFKSLENGKFSEITRTITNTVYQNVEINGLNRLNQLGSKLNPYNVNVTIK